MGRRFGIQARMRQRVNAMYKGRRSREAHRRIGFKCVQCDQPSLGVYLEKDEFGNVVAATVVCGHCGYRDTNLSPPFKQLTEPRDFVNQSFDRFRQAMQPQTMQPQTVQELPQIPQIPQLPELREKP